MEAFKGESTTHVELVNSNEQHVPYEKNGLRTYGDGEDHDVDPPVILLAPILCNCSSRID